MGRSSRFSQRRRSLYTFEPFSGPAINLLLTRAKSSVRSRLRLKSSFARSRAEMASSSNHFRITWCWPFTRNSQISRFIEYHNDITFALYISFRQRKCSIQFLTSGP